MNVTHDFWKAVGPVSVVAFRVLSTGKSRVVVSHFRAVERPAVKALVLDVLPGVQPGREDGWLSG